MKMVKITMFSNSLNDHISFSEYLNTESTTDLIQPTNC